ncbi:hypothetical protein BDZ89DRAFT_1168239 [Hymenopellis radicata]|nr:hypothetical protein BDZ89DRAFT_1168239 [Hymenopellis radicata]
MPVWTAFIDGSELPTAKRIRSARLHLNDESFGRKLLSSMPDVEILEIGVPGNSSHCIVDGSNVGHRLQSLDLRCGSIALGSLLDVLSGAPLLRSLNVCRVAEPPGVVGHYRFGVVTHPLLSSFLVSSSTTADNIALFNHITFPALQSLDVTAAADGEAHVWPLPCNNAFIRRSGCRLNQLIIRDYVIDDRITEILSSQQDLVDLQLNRPGDDTRHVGTPGRTSPSRRLRYQHSVSPLVVAFLSRETEDGLARPLPSLKRLRIAVRTLLFFTAATYMVRSRSGTFARQSGVAILEEVDLLVIRQGNCEVCVTEAEQRDMFRSFTKAGMRVSIAHQSSV